MSILRDLCVNFKCDLILLKSKKIKFIHKIKIILQKYLTLPFILLGKKRFRFNLFGNGYKTDDILGILGFQVMIKDFHEYYYLPDLPSQSVIFDIGANVGNFSLCADIFYPKSKIFAFEPVSNTFRILSFNCKHKTDIKCYQLAFGENEGELTLHIPKGGSDRASFDKSKFKEINTYSEKTKKTTLDKFISKNNLRKIDLLKIDVEGFEYEVIRGAKKSLTKCEYLLIEFHLKDFPDKSNKLIKYLINENFLLFSIGKVWKNKNQIHLVDLIFKKIDVRG